ncbi:hypothetical protein [Gynuella sp.]|uniref:hypothetical protein n=1 Tax=Gynuella sp. TaxID=2969146 RepID=UPI003D0DCDFF
MAKFRGICASGSLTGALEKFAPGVKGKLSPDSVKLGFRRDNYEIKYDLADGYFRIFDLKKNQSVDIDGKLPKNGYLNGQEAKDAAQQQTHFNNTDQK